MSALGQGFVEAWTRLQDRRFYAFALFAVMFVVFVAFIERGDAFSTADQALTGGTFGIALPVFAYVVSFAMIGRMKFSDRVRPLSRHGLDGRLVALGLVLALLLAVAVSGAVFGVATVLVARGTESGVLFDSLITAWVGSVAGASYSSGFVLGSVLGRHGGGRTWFLFLDWLLGAGTGVAALPWPRGHVRHLLGGEPVRALSQPESFALLGCLVSVYVVASILRTKR